MPPTTEFRLAETASKCLHSNSNIYDSNNGPNLICNDVMTGCGPGESKHDVIEGDKINLLKKGGHYGAPNQIRALIDNDPHQCVWRSQFEPSGPAVVLSQPLRGNIIAANYQGSLSYRFGTRWEKRHSPIRSVHWINGRFRCVGCDPSTRRDFDRHALYFHKPIEPPTNQLRVLSIFPRRGGRWGGNSLVVYGLKFRLGNKQRYTFQRGYRYISGLSSNDDDWTLLGADIHLPSTPTLSW